MDAISAILKFFVPGLLTLALCFTFVFIFTRKGSKLRNWVLATPNRTGSVGVGALLLIWICIVTYNRFFGA